MSETPEVGVLFDPESGDPTLLVAKGHLSDRAFREAARYHLPDASRWLGEVRRGHGRWVPSPDGAVMYFQECPPGRGAFAATWGTCRPQEGA